MGLGRIFCYYSPMDSPLPCPSYCCAMVSKTHQATCIHTIPKWYRGICCTGSQQPHLFRLKSVKACSRQMQCQLRRLAPGNSKPDTRAQSRWWLVWKTVIDCMTQKDSCWREALGRVAAVVTEHCRAGWLQLDGNKETQPKEKGCWKADELDSMHVGHCLHRYILSGN